MIDFWLGMPQQECTLSPLVSFTYLLLHLDCVVLEAPGEKIGLLHLAFRGQSPGSL
jgi:hypothetical protein